MDQHQDFSKLRNLLALKKLEMPLDTQIDQFLIEFHRRQRAQLLVPASPLARALAWVKERMEGLEFVPTLSYASALAVIAITAFVGFSQQVQVSQTAGHPYELSFRLNPHDGAFAMIPSSFASLGNPSLKSVESQNFTPNRSDTATTRFVLANNSRVAYDATVAF
jgi:hypothetical protein